MLPKIEIPGIDLRSVKDGDLLTAVVGVFVPLAVAVIQQPQWSRLLRAWMRFALCVAIALALSYAQGLLDTGTVLHRFLIVFVACYVFYNALWKFVGADSLEGATNLPSLSGAINAYFERRARDAEDSRLIAEQEARDRADKLARAKAALVEQAKARMAREIDEELAARAARLAASAQNSAGRVAVMPTVTDVVATSAPSTTTTRGENTSISGGTTYDATN